MPHERWAAKVTKKATKTTQGGATLLSPNAGSGNQKGKPKSGNGNHKKCLANAGRQECRPSLLQIHFLIALQPLDAVNSTQGGATLLSPNAGNGNQATQYIT